MNPLRLFFEELAAEWDSQQPPNREENLRDLLRPFQHLLEQAGSILELGTGTGALSPIILNATRQPRLVSVDLAYAMLRRARQRVVGNHLAQTDIHTLPFPDKSFDLAICHNCFPHLADKQTALIEIRRTLVSGSWLLILHDGSREMINRIHREAANPVIHNDLIPPPRESFNILDSCGFEEIRVEDAGHYFTLTGRKS